MAKKLTAAQVAERTEALENLRRRVEDSDGTVYTILRHVSASGMSRSISIIVIGKDGKPDEITGTYARATGYRTDQTHGGIKMTGAGMDMGYALVYNMSRVLWPDGYDCIGEHCPGNDHANDPYPARLAGSMRHHDGGYRLRHQWL